MARFRNRDRVLAALKRVPAVIKAAVQEQGDKEVQGLAEAVQRAAPVGSALEAHPGDLKASIRGERDPRQELKWRVVIDPKDEQGKPYAAHVEFGHRARNGEHVPPVPFAFPTKRAMAPGIRRRMSKAGRQAAKKYALTAGGFE